MKGLGGEPGALGFPWVPGKYLSAPRLIFLLPQPGTSPPVTREGGRPCWPVLGSLTSLTVPSDSWPWVSPVLPTPPPPRSC